ncbi:NAD(P)H-dependent oxidoreductase [Paucibacter sp. PLA-PC-4]|uniref:NAD(P)H-dependent oxidoreductase n=1 Tax=Paucibacter sp. PLA-PC-4 TaxID=2993655 RepID=UPI0022490956|nr:NAD(P)H-dependent oxidoreductase [Paucibacter sp. PLA-PC-4]MCX2860545.1 NAD(P)H-dependent oxidoreductase [Paucibacter sp. PLA-PC-4]
MSRLLIIQGHPDSSAPHLCHALADAYASGALDAGHELRRVEVAQLDFPLLRSQTEWQQGTLPVGLQEAQDAIAWCQHLLIVFPLWLGDMPALLKGFLEQVARPGFAFHSEGNNMLAKKGLAGRSARVLVTMGMPAALYRYYFRAHSLKSLERNILGFVGIAPVHETLVGGVEGLSEAARKKWLARLRKLGSEAA